MLTSIGVGMASQDDTQTEATADEEIAQPLLSTTQKPRWEFGIGGGYLWGYDYPASRDANERGIALPFIIYRTSLLRFGGGGLRAVAIENPRVKLDLSISGSLNASSQDNSARQGMPDLDFLFEIGPQLEVKLFDRTLASEARLRARFTSELRAVFSSDFSSADARGFVAEFGVGMNIENIANTNIGFFTSFDTTFASEELQDYFYEVGPRYVTDSRPRYDASGGYLESSLFVGFGFKPLPQVRLFTGLGVGFFNGASNQASPLFEVTEQTRFALGFVWTIKTSKDMIDVVELGTAN